MSNTKEGTKGGTVNLKDLRHIESNMVDINPTLSVITLNRLKLYNISIQNYSTYGSSSFYYCSFQDVEDKYNYHGPDLIF